MEQLILSAGELMLAAEKMGAQFFYGLPDPFFGMDSLEITQAVTELSLSLEEKGYAKMGFDDSFALTEEAERLIGICAHCDGYILTDCLSTGRQVPIFYLRGEEAVELVHDAETLLLRPIGGHQIAGQLWEALMLPGGTEPLSEEVGSISLAVLARARECPDREAAHSLLTGDGCPNALAGLLAEALWEKAGCYTLNVLDLVRHTVEQIILIPYSGCCLRLTPDKAGPDDRRTLRAISGSAVKQEIETLCGNLTGKEAKSDEMP